MSLPCDQKDSLFYVVTEPEFNELPYEYQRRFKKYSNVISKANKGLDSKRYRKSDGLGKLPLEKKNQKDFDSELNEFVTGVPGVTFDNIGNFFYKGVRVGSVLDPTEVVKANVKAEQQKHFRTALNVSKAIGKLRPKPVQFRNPLNIEQIRKYYPGYYTMQYSVAKWYADNYFENGVVIKYVLLKPQNYVRLTDLTIFNYIIDRLTLKAEVDEVNRDEINDLIKKLKFMYQYNMSSDEQQKIKIRECRLYDIELRKQRGAPAASKNDAEPILKNRCSIPNIDFVVMKKLCSMIEDDIFIFDEVPTVYGTYGPKFHSEVVICRPEILSDQGEVRDGSDEAISLDKRKRGTFPTGTVFYKAFPANLKAEDRQLWLIENASTEEEKKKATEDLMAMFDEQAKEFENYLP
jgi:hypothetical protein